MSENNKDLFNEVLVESRKYAVLLTILDALCIVCLLAHLDRCNWQFAAEEIISVVLSALLTAYVIIYVVNVAVYKVSVTDNKIQIRSVLGKKTMEINASTVFIGFETSKHSKRTYFDIRTAGEHMIVTTTKGEQLKHTLCLFGATDREKL